MTRARDVSNIDGLLTAKGDIYAATAAGTPARLGVGTDGQVLTAASGQSTGLQWATVSAGANWSLLNAGGTALSAGTTTISGISGKDKIMILWKQASATGAAAFSFRLNGDTAANYYGFGWGNYLSATYNTAALITNSGIDGAAVSLQEMAYWASATSISTGYISLTGCNSSGVKVYQGVAASGAGSTGTTGTRTSSFGGYYNSSSTISSISLLVDAGTFDAGTVYVYASA
jgi:hypothetical protein